MTREVQTKAGNHGKVIYYLRNQLRFRIAQHLAMPRGFPTKPRVCLRCRRARQSPFLAEHRGGGGQRF